MKKLIIVFLVGVVIGVCAENQRLKDTKYGHLVKIANQQAVEIAIIEQASKLENYKQQLSAKKKAITDNKICTPPIADPKDIDVSK